MIRRYILVTGLVQGVGFRWFARTTAAELGVTGWVHNRADTAVELEVQGSTAAVEAFVRAVEEGPRFAQVDRVEVRCIPPRDECGFHVLDAW